LARRRESEPPEEQVRMNSSEDIAAWFRPLLQDLPHEECHLMLMRQNFTVMDTCLLSRGGLTESAVDVRLILQHALLKGAPVIALCHNHPSGNLRPSRADDQITANLKRACEVMRIHLLDHVIVSDHGYYSYANEGKL